MTNRARRVLPMISASPEDVAAANSAARSRAESGQAAERVAAGWKFRFVAEGPRAEEMIQLYGELGFEVAADLVEADAVGEATEDCEACQAVAAGRFTAIYTRLGQPPDSTGEAP